MDLHTNFKCEADWIGSWKKKEEKQAAKVKQIAFSSGSCVDILVETIIASLVKLESDAFKT